MKRPPQHPRPRRALLIAACIAAAFSLAVGCSAADPDAERRTGERAPDLSTEEIVDEAIEFGLISIPEGVTVLAAHTDTGIDTLYQIALRTDQDGVERFLSDSHITARPVPAIYLPFSILAGPPLELSPSGLDTSDRIRREDGKTISRYVVIDERDAGTRYLHVQVFDT